MMKLYDYFRSTACYRVRIALNIKGIAYEKVDIHLINDGGQQHSAEYSVINPQHLVPSLEVNGQIVHQSLAIIDYLDETFPSPALLPQDPMQRAMVRSLALIIACDMHPLNNLRVLNQLKREFHADEEHVMQWYHHWLRAGFNAFETKLRSLQRSQDLCVGDSISLADLCLIPQVYNAKRFHFPLQDYPLICKINDYCCSLEAFQQAAPEA